MGVALGPQVDEREEEPAEEEGHVEGGDDVQDLRVSTLPGLPPSCSAYANTWTETHMYDDHKNGDHPRVRRRIRVHLLLEPRGRLVK